MKSDKRQKNENEKAFKSYLLICKFHKDKNHV